MPARLRIHLRLLVAALAAVALTAAAPHRDWNAVVALTPAHSHVLGNPAAQVRLAEFVSYTCPHCADFEVQSEGPLRLEYVHSGKVSVEIRHLLRDPVDLTVALLTNCGPSSKFMLNHAAFMRSQSTWIRPMVTASEAQRARWAHGDFVQRNRAIASDFHFYQIMATRGYDRIAVDRCLADHALAEKIAAQTKAATDIGVDSTPSFTLDGALLAGTHEWDLLKAQIDAKLGG